jgi:hypothetical protein
MQLGPCRREEFAGGGLIVGARRDWVLGSICASLGYLGVLHRLGAEPAAWPASGVRRGGACPVTALFGGLKTVRLGWGRSGGTRG